MAALGANAEFIIAKHRNGSLDRKGLYFDENKTKFMDPDDVADTDRHDALMHADANGGNNNWEQTAQSRTGLPPVSPNDAFGPPAPQGNWSIEDKSNNDTPF